MTRRAPTPTVPPADTAGTAGTAGLIIGTATQDQWRTVEGWAVAEGWRPGLGDTGLLFSLDPGRFRLGWADGAAAAAVGLVRYSDRFAFLGSLLVRRDARGHGLGTLMLEHALALAGNRTVAVEATPATQPFFIRHGFTAAWRTVRYAGAPRPLAKNPRHLVSASVEDLLLRIVELDARTVPGPRPEFAAGWATGPKRHTRAAVDDLGRLAYGVLRPSGTGFRIGPLTAEGPLLAADVFDALAAQAADLAAEQIAVDVPETNRAAVVLAETRGLTAISQTVRMYRPGADGPPQHPHPGHDLVYGLTSLEAG